MGIEEFSAYDGLGLAKLVSRGEVTPLELVDASIARIERHNPALNAVVHTAFDEARAQASLALPAGPFQGVPFLIKDLGLAVKGWPRTSGSRFVANVIDQEDSILVERYRDAGVIPLGKTNTPEFGITGTTESALLGPCRNPWNVGHSAGGSSGGSAAAVASGMVPLAHASDGLGSIRIPAACCGLFGLKTTRDRNPQGPDDGDRSIGFSVDHVVSRTVRDSAAMLDATGFVEPASPYAYPPKERPYLEEIDRSAGRLRIGWSAETPSGAPIDPIVQAALEATADTLEALGHNVFPASLGVDYRTLYRAQGCVSAANFGGGMARLIAQMGREPTESELEPLTWSALMAARRLTAEQAGWGWQTMRIMNRQILARFEAFDVYLCPVMGTPPPPIGYIDPVGLDPKEVNRRQAGVFPFTPPFNFTGQPSMSVPLAQSPTGLPIGMMFTGRYGDEGTLFRLAGQLEKELPWRDRKPPVWG